jgi:hypothetical protein
MLLSPIAFNYTSYVQWRAHIYAIYCKLSGTYGRRRFILPALIKMKNQKNTDGKKDLEELVFAKRTTITTP